MHSDTAGGNFADALMMIARLPLTDVERADAVRQLLAAVCIENEHCERDK